MQYSCGGEMFDEPNEQELIDADMEADDAAWYHHNQLLEQQREKEEKKEQ
jgi:hypothetical protein